MSNRPDLGDKTRAKMTVWFDNVRLSTGPRRSALSGISLVHDMVEADRPARLDWLLHTIVPIQTDFQGKSFDAVCERAALHGCFLSPEAMKLEVSTGFPVEPVNRYSTEPVPRDQYFPEWRLTAASAGPVKTAEFLAAMQVRRLADPGEAAVEIRSVDAENAHGVEIRYGERRHLVLFRHKGCGGPIGCGELASNGDVAAAELDGQGRIYRALTVQATYLKHGQTSLWQNASRESWTMPH